MKNTPIKRTDLDISRAQFGVCFERRGSNDPHVLVQIYSEDDENWFECGSMFSSFWIDDLINVLNEAKKQLKKNFKKDKSGFGFEFKYDL